MRPLEFASGTPRPTEDEPGPLKCLDLGLGRTSPSKAPSLPFPDVCNHRRTETDKAGPGSMPHAGIDDAERTGIEKSLRQGLRRDVAIRIETVGETSVAANVMQVGTDIRTVVIVRGVILEPADLGQLHGFSKRHLGVGGLDLERAVPGAAIRTVEPAPERVGMGEGGIDDPVMRNPKHQLVQAYAGQQIVLGKKTIVRRVVEIEDIGEVLIIIGNTREDACAVLAIFRRDQPVRVVLTNKRRARQRWVGHIPPRRASTNRRTVSIAGTPPLIMYERGVCPPKMRLEFESRIHSSARGVEWRMFSALKMPTR